MPRTRRIPRPDPDGSGHSRAGADDAPALAPLRRFPATCNVAQLCQIGLMPVSEQNRPSPARRMFDRKGSSGTRQNWADVIRSHYDAAAQEPVPEEFRNLMDEIARKIEK